MKKQQDDGDDCAVCETMERIDNDDDQAHLIIHKIIDGRYAIFTPTGDYIETVGYDQVNPLILYPSKRRQYLKELKKHLEKSSQLCDTII